MRATITAVAAASVLALATGAGAQNQHPKNAQDALQQLNGTDPIGREIAFSWLSEHKALKRSPAIAQALIRTIDLETHLIWDTWTKSHGERGMSDEYGEGYGEYTGNLVQACMKYCDLDDPRTIRTLAASPFSNAFSDILISKHPSEAVPALIASVATGSMYLTAADIPILADMRWQSRSLTAAERDRIDGALISCISSKNWVESELAIPRIAFMLRVDTTITAVRRQGYHAAMRAATQSTYEGVRAVAAEGLVVFHDLADEPRLSELATSDAAPHVRAAAQKSLSALQKLR